MRTSRYGRDVHRCGALAPDHSTHELEQDRHSQAPVRDLGNRDRICMNEE